MLVKWAIEVKTVWHQAIEIITDLDIIRLENAQVSYTRFALFVL